MVVTTWLVIFLKTIFLLYGEEWICGLWLCETTVWMYAKVWSLWIIWKSLCENLRPIVLRSARPWFEFESLRVKPLNLLIRLTCLSENSQYLIVLWNRGITLWLYDVVTIHSKCMLVKSFEKSKIVMVVFLG